MELIQLLLFIMIILTLLNGLLFFKKLIKLQKETNNLLKKLCDKGISEDISTAKNAMRTEDLEKLKASYIANMKIDKYVK
jgi:hypothetical protein